MRVEFVRVDKYIVGSSRKWSILLLPAELWLYWRVVVLRVVLACTKAEISLIILKESTLLFWLQPLN